MRKNSFNPVAVLLLLAAALLFNTSGFAASAEEAVVIGIDSASAKVGERTAVIVKVTPRDGFKISKSYNNRIIKLSSVDDGVAFEREVVRAGTETAQGLVFSVGATPTKPGSHAINGIIRFSFHDGERMDMKSVPLITTVTGTE